MRIVTRRTKANFGSTAPVSTDVHEGPGRLEAARGSLTAIPGLNSCVLDRTTLPIAAELRRKAKKSV